MHADLPDWAEPILSCPRTGSPLTAKGNDFIAADGSRAATIESGVIRFPIEQNTDGIRHYRQKGGARFHERRHVPYAMSSLDTDVYRAHLERFYGGVEGIFVDVGAGDGRNARHVLEAGHRRVVFVDVSAEALARFRTRLLQTEPSWLDRCLFIEADARALPLAGRCAERVIAIESLYYLNEDYSLGLAQAKRLLAPQGRLLVSERDFEGGLVMRVLYAGVREMIESARTGSLWDGDSHGSVRTRSFTEEQLVKIFEDAGLRILGVEGMPLMSLILGWSARNAQVEETDDSLVLQVRAILEDLARSGRSRRCHVVVAESADPPADQNLATQPSAISDSHDVRTPPATLSIDGMNRAHP